MDKRFTVALCVMALLGLAAFGVRQPPGAAEDGEHPCDRRDVPMPPGVWDRAPDATSPLVGSWAGLWDGFRASRLVVTSVSGGEVDLTYGIVAWGDGLGPYRGGFDHVTVPVARDGHSFAWGPLAFRFDPSTDTLLGTYVADGRLGGAVVMSRCPPTR